MSEHSRRVRTLVVEDDTALLRLLATLLSARGHEVRTAATGAEALTQFAEQPADLVVLDLVLPDADGLEVCRRLRQAPAGDDAAILVCTRRRSPEDLRDVLAAGATDYLAKPLQMALFNVRITVLEQQIARRLARENTHVYADTPTPAPARSLPGSTGAADGFRYEIQVGSPVGARPRSTELATGRSTRSSP